jgi:hypothetical protein
MYAPAGIPMIRPSVRKPKKCVTHPRQTTPRDEGQSKPGLGSRISARFKDIGLDSELPELHGEEAVPVRF